MARAMIICIDTHEFLIIHAAGDDTHEHNISQATIAEAKQTRSLLDEVSAVSHPARVDRVDLQLLGLLISVLVHVHLILVFVLVFIFVLVFVLTLILVFICIVFRLAVADGGGSDAPKHGSYREDMLVAARTREEGACTP